jgi:hypothetical protein
MKLFGFFFFLILTCLVAGVAWSMWTLLYAHSYMWRVYLLMILTVDIGIVCLSILYMFPRIKERDWVRIMFLPMNLCIWLYGLSILLQVLPQVPQRLVEGITYLSSLFGYAGVVLLVAGCFCIQSPLLRKGFRLWGTLLIAVTALYVGEQLLEYDFRVPVFLASGLSWALMLAVFVPPLLLNYQLWKGTPEVLSLEDSVEKIGLSEDIP